MLKLLLISVAFCCPVQQEGGPINEMVKTHRFKRELDATGQFTGAVAEQIVFQDVRQSLIKLPTGGEPCLGYQVTSAEIDVNATGTSCYSLACNTSSGGRGPMGTSMNFRYNAPIIGINNQFGAGSGVSQTRNDNSGFGLTKISTLQVQGTTARRLFSITGSNLEPINDPDADIFFDLRTILTFDHRASEGSYTLDLNGSGMGTVRVDYRVSQDPVIESMAFYVIPVLFNTYPGSGATFDDISDALARANRIFKPAKIRFTFFGLIPQSQNLSTPGSTLDQTVENKYEHAAYRGAGMDEIAMTGNPYATKVSIVDKIIAVDPMFCAFGQKSTSKFLLLANPADDCDYGRTLAHELAHTLGLPDIEDDPQRLMYFKGCLPNLGTQFTEAEINTMRQRARPRAACVCMLLNSPGPGIAPTISPIMDTVASGVSTSVDVGFQLVAEADAYIASDSNDIEMRLSLADEVPEQGADASYLVSIDVDGDPNTGSEILGKTGVDFQVEVDISNSQLTAMLLDGDGNVVPSGLGMLALNSNPADIYDPPTDPNEFLMDAGLIGTATIDFTLVDIGGIAGDVIVHSLDGSGRVADEFQVDFRPRFQDGQARLVSTVGSVSRDLQSGLPISGSGFEPNEDVEIFLDDSLATTLAADSEGELFIELNSTKNILPPNEFIFATGIGVNSRRTGFLVVQTTDQPVILGDVNLDGIVNLLDVEPFIDRLSTGTFQAEADTDQNGVINLLDVEPFIAILAGR